MMTTIATRLRCHDDDDDDNPATTTIAEIYARCGITVVARSTSHTRLGKDRSRRGGRRRAFARDTFFLYVSVASSLMVA